MIHREGGCICVPDNAQETAEGYEFDEYRLNPSNRPVPRKIVDAMADAMEDLGCEAIQRMDISARDAIYLAAAYPAWDGEKKWRAGDRVVYAGILYERQQPWAGPEAHPPGVDTASLWRPIVEDHTGSKTDPVPYASGMILEKGLHYRENETVYLCVRDSGNQVFETLSYLATEQGGKYVERQEEKL